jgi:hypothetical protein
MIDLSQSRISMYLMRVYVIGAAALFIATEFLVVVAIVRNQHSHVDARFGLYLLPFLVASPPIAGFQAYLHIKRNLSGKGMDVSSWAAIRYQFALQLAIVCGVLAATLAVLLTTP